MTIPVVSCFTTLTFAALIVVLGAIATAAADDDNNNNKRLLRHLQDPLVDCSGVQCPLDECTGDQVSYRPDGECCDACADCMTTCPFGYTDGCTVCTCNSEGVASCSFQLPCTGTARCFDESGPPGAGLNPFQPLTPANMCDTCDTRFWDTACGGQLCICYDGQPVCPDPSTCSEVGSKFCYELSSYEDPTLSDVASLLAGHVSMLEDKVADLLQSLVPGGPGVQSSVRRSVLNAVDEVKGAVDAVQNQLDNPVTGPGP